MSASVPSVSALTAMTAAATPAKDASRSGQDFEAALSTARHQDSTPVVRPEGRPERPAAQQQQRNQGETPQHQVLPAKPKTPGTRSTDARPAHRTPSSVPKPVPAHPDANPVAAAELQSAAPAHGAPGAESKGSDAVTAVSTAAGPEGTENPAPAADPATPGQPSAGDPAGQPEAPPTPLAASPIPVPGSGPEAAPGTQPVSTGPPSAAPTAEQTQQAVQQAGQQAVQQATQQVAEQPPTATPAPDVVAQAAPVAHQHPGSAEGVAPTQPGATVAVTSSAAPAGRPSGGEGGSQDQGRQPTTTSHSHVTADPSTTQGPETPYSTLADRGAAVAANAAGADPRTAEEMPATQSLPAGTLDRVNAAEHSVRVQVETDGLGKLTAELHSRPGEIGVHLSVPDDIGRALMAQRMDALRDSLGQSGSAVHLSLAAREQNSQGQQGYTPREDRAPAQSAPQPHDAATPRATDGSPAALPLSAPADGSRLVDVRA